MHGHLNVKIVQAMSVFCPVGTMPLFLCPQSSSANTTLSELQTGRIWESSKRKKEKKKPTLSQIQ